MCFVVPLWKFGLLRGSSGRCLGVYNTLLNVTANERTAHMWDITVKRSELCGIAISICTGRSRGRIATGSK
jgi:hypothetical protein